MPPLHFCNDAAKIPVTPLRGRWPSQAASIQKTTANLQMSCNAASQKPHRAVENACKNKIAVASDSPSLHREPDGALRRTKRTFSKRRFVVRQKSSPNIPEQSSPMFASSPKKFAYQPAVPFSLRCAYVAAMSATEITGQKQRPAHLFKPGVSGNPAGRPRGSRNRLADAFIFDLAACWETHGIEALEKCATEEPSQFLRVIASLMPKDINLTVGIDAAAFADRFAQAAALLGNPAPRQIRKPLPGQRVIEHGE